MTIHRVFGRELSSKLEMKVGKEVFTHMNTLLMAIEMVHNLWPNTMAIVGRKLHAQTLFIPIILPENFNDVLRGYGKSYGLDIWIIETIPPIKISTWPKTKAALLYSGGAESKYLSMTRKVPSDPFTLPGVDDRYDAGVEIPAILAAIMSGYQLILLGDERSIEMDIQHPNDEFLQSVSKAFNVKVELPLKDKGLSKSDILKELYDNACIDTITPCFATEAANYSNIDISAQNYKASSNKNYCGNCSKCWITYKELRSISREPGFNITAECEDRQFEKIRQFLEPNDSYDSIIKSLEAVPLLTAFLHAVDRHQDYSKLQAKLRDFLLCYVKDKSEYPRFTFEEFVQFKLR